jgi:hypothetical protein
MVEASALPRGAVMPYLHVLRGPNKGAVFVVGDTPVVLGRDPDCDVPILMTAVSRRHARIVRGGDSHFIEDLQSRNGTFLNDLIVPARRALKNNDRIRIGSFIAAFLDQAPASVTEEELIDIALGHPIPDVLTEQQWLDSTDPGQMLDLLATEAMAERLGLFHAGVDAALELVQVGRGEANWQRKFRLFICACARRIWHLVTRPANRRGIEVAERYADGEATEEELSRARADMARGNLSESMVAYFAAREGPALVPQDAHYAIQAVETTRRPFWQDRRQGERAERAELAALLRDIFRPFSPVAVDPAWLRWEGGLVPRLAGAAYEQRCLPEGTLEPDRVRVLADAVEDAGCACAELLAHLRGPGTHVRGCWAVDLLRSESRGEG